MKEIRKITPGCVVQVYDPETGKCIRQSFVANAIGPGSYWKNEEMGSINCPGAHHHQPFDMVQPPKPE